MEIIWHGLSCFRMKERGLASVVTDPYEPKLGLPELSLKAEVVTISHDAPGHNYLQAVKGDRLQIAGPGEFEVGGVFITGIAMRAKGKEEGSNGRMPNTLYVFSFDGLTVAHLGDLAYVPSQSQIEDLGPVDVALVPVGGAGALTAGQAAEVISLIDPPVVIPMFFKTGDEKFKLAPVDKFLSEMGVGEKEPVNSLKLSKSALSDQTQVIVLEPAT